MYTVDRDGDGVNDSEDDGREPLGVPRTPAVSQIGTRLSDIIRDRVGESPCALCRQSIQRLNGMTPDEVDAQRGQIVADFAKHAAKRTGSWWLGLALRADQLTGGAGAAYAFGRWLDEAVEAERHARTSQSVR